MSFYWLADCSGSMARDGKIQALNTAAREALPHMREVAAGNPYARPLVRVMRFATGAEWQSAEAVPLAELVWTDLVAGGVTDMGAALSLLAEDLSGPAMPDRGLAPVIVLVSDGQPTDDFNAGLAALNESAWGSKAVRLAIAIGRDADRDVLAAFVGDPSVPLLVANAPEALVRQIRWASTIGLASSSSPPSGPVSSAMHLPASSPSSALRLPPSGPVSSAMHPPVVGGEEDPELEVW